MADKKEVSVSFDTKTLDFYKRYAAESERTIQQLIRWALKQTVKRHKIDGFDMTGFPGEDAK